MRILYRICVLALVAGLCACCAGQERAPSRIGEPKVLQIPDIQMVRIEPGSFLMGSDAPGEETGPAHRVNISRAFSIGAMEVTQVQLTALMGASKNDSQDGSLPADTWTWGEAMEFCRRLTDAERSRGNVPAGLVYRLPTEAEWEYCARAGTTTKYFFGDDENLLGDYAWFGEGHWSLLHSVGMKKPNPWGLYDMYGNAAEWCLDWYGEYSADEQSDPMGRESGDCKVLRGGSSSNTRQECSSASRDVGGIKGSDVDRGFRVVLGTDVLGEMRAREEAWRKKVLETIPKGLVAIAPGSFLMGSDYYCGDMPVHRVNITHGFMMGATEVTQAQYRAVKGWNPSSNDGDDLPVESLDWFEAMDFCRQLTEIERKKGRLPAGMAYRLPTEAEWEYCCRAGSTAEYCFGDDLDASGEERGQLADYAWYGYSGTKTHPVGTKKPNAWGLYDMHGNVEELCYDWDDSFPKEMEEQTDPVGAATGQDFVLRGGAAGYAAEFCRSTRGSRPFHTSSNDADVGFRVVLGQPIATAAVPLSPKKSREASALRKFIRESPVPMVAISPGSFLMGSEEDDEFENSKPVHRVNLTRAFCIGETKITQGQYVALMGLNPCVWRGDDLAVIEVSWFDAMEFCCRLTESEKKKGRLPTGMEYRLPTEAEWEYCARAGTTTKYFFGVGDDIRLSIDFAWIGGFLGSMTHPMRQKKPNQWGLYDLYGYDDEWCLDWYREQYEANEQTDPLVELPREEHVLRGWNSVFRSGSSPGGTERMSLRVVLGSEISAGCVARTQKAIEEAEPPPGIITKPAFAMVLIKPGSFLMGSGEGDDDEKPVHRVNITYEFYMGATEVTQALYKEVKYATPGKFKGDDLPVEQVSWADAVEFCRRLTETERWADNLAEDMEYRLPTEAEWEYCCRAGSTAKYFFGDDESLLGEYAWFGENSDSVTHPVGKKKPNSWGLYDMYGNVREWCLDRYMPYPTEAGPQSDPVGPKTGENGILRGGSFCDDAQHARSSYRIEYSQKRWACDVGFRVVLGPPIEVK